MKIKRPCFALAKLITGRCLTTKTLIKETDCMMETFCEHVQWTTCASFDIFLLIFHHATILHKYYRYQDQHYQWYIETWWFRFYLLSTNMTSLQTLSDIFHFVNNASKSRHVLKNQSVVGWMLFLHRCQQDTRGPPALWWTFRTPNAVFRGGPLASCWHLWTKSLHPTTFDEKAALVVSAI